MKVLISTILVCFGIIVYAQPAYTLKTLGEETWWFKLIAFSLLLTLIYLAYRFRIKQIQVREKIRSDDEITLHELENSALRSQMNPHFIFNSLNTISAFINNNENSKANQYISKFSKLIRLILHHAWQKKMILANELEILDLYMQLEKVRFENKFDYEVNIADDVDINSTEIPSLIIQPFVENAILHGLLPLKTEGNIKVGIKRKGNFLICTIEDNGIGRNKAIFSKQIHINKEVLHNTEATLKRIELFNKEHKTYIPVAVTDLIDFNGNPLGTKIEITLAWQERF